MSMIKVIAVIPAYNEQEHISDVVTKTKQYVDEVIVIDDFSRDNTREVAKQAGAVALRNPCNMGAGFSTRVGCDIAIKKGADIIVTLDGDGQHDPADIPLLTKKIEQGYDIVFGSRPRDENMPAIKRVGNAMLSGFARMLFGVNVTDSQTGFHAFTNKTYKKIRWSSNRYEFVSEFISQVAKHKVKYSEVSVKTIYNDEDKVGMTKLDALKAVKNMVLWRIKQ